ncbi:MAG: phosphoribosylformylglycinamidine synthase subunit PurL [Pseudomonadota bacterium]
MSEPSPASNPAGPHDDAVVAQHGLSREDYADIEKQLGRAPNLVELGIFSVMWSEHCSYKSSRRHLKTLPTTAPWVICGPGENAGVIDIGMEEGEEALAAIFKMESHNHPSFIEPYQGAATGVGGIMRDVFTMGARPVANLNALRFGAIDHPKTAHLVRGVVAGIGGYGNCMGVPTVGGETNFDPGYNGNILVNAMTVGIAPKHKIFYSTARGAGNPVVYVGAKTGRDGIHGATMASAEFDDASAEKRPTVQVGDPFTEKLLLEACLELMASDAIIAIQDMGAAGLTSSSVEMAAKGAEAGEGGFDLNLDSVPQRETHMTAYEMMLSESQERMLMVLKPGREDDARAIFEKWGVDFAVIGETTDTGRLRIYHHGDLQADLPVGPLADAAPNYDRPSAPAPAPEPLGALTRAQTEILITLTPHAGAQLPPETLVTTLRDEQFTPLGPVASLGWRRSGATGTRTETSAIEIYAVVDGPDVGTTMLQAALDNMQNASVITGYTLESETHAFDLADQPGGMPLLTALAQMMADPALCSRRWIWEQYDHTVMGDTVVQPGGDAALVRVHGSKRGLAMTTDVTPRYVQADPREGARQAVAETYRNICAVGASPLAITNCLNFGNPERPEIMAQFVGAIAGMREACEALDYPVVSGNVSLYNETNGQAIPPTPAIGGVGVIPDVAKAVRVGGAIAGEELILVGMSRGWLGQSLYLNLLFDLAEGPPPPVDLAAERAHGEFIRKLIDDNLITACHDVSDGGTLVAAAEMALACGEGLELNTPVKTGRAAFWFGEDQGRYLVAAAPGVADTVLLKAAMAGVQASRIGRFGGRDIRLDPHIAKQPAPKTRANPVKPRGPAGQPHTPDILSLQALDNLWQSTLPSSMDMPGPATATTHPDQETTPMPMAANDIKSMILEALPDAAVEIEDLAGDGDHYRARIVSAAFAGKSRVQQHQLVYRALKGKMGGELHALALETAAPE